MTNDQYYSLIKAVAQVIEEIDKEIDEMVPQPNKSIEEIENK